MTTLYMSLMSASPALMKLVKSPSCETRRRRSAQGERPGLRGREERLLADPGGPAPARAGRGEGAGYRRDGAGGAAQGVRRTKLGRSGSRRG